ncbi:MAG TPA: class I SAM-dependent methyltransferase [Chloroflexi bacterium]|jgi:SAM-dependent methyltransferase|nr:class I SAM-dependent methyltransferase [Chloroflexota bacterium]
MQKPELAEWFAANKSVLETAYLADEQPWQQSGFGLHSPRTYERWEACRKPVADVLDSSGSFLDIGCANGFLLECVLHWAGERGFSIVPYGLDLSKQLVALASLRLPAYVSNLFVGNAWDWTPPHPFDTVRTELEYVPSTLHGAYMARILDRYLHPGGKLLVAEYRGRTDANPALSIDRRLSDHGFSVGDVTIGKWEGVEQTRVAVIWKSHQEPRGKIPW